MSGLNPKLVQFLRAFAQLPPSERPSALLSIGVPPNLLSTELPKFEMQAEALGFQLNNGEAEVSGEGAAGIAGPISFARVRAARAPPSRNACSPAAFRHTAAANPRRTSTLPPQSPHPPQIWEATWDRALQWGGLALFWGAVPLVLFLIKERRGVSWEALAAQVMRLPFAD